MSTRGDLDAINEAATFLPQQARDEKGEWDGTRPCITVAGVQVYAYITPVDGLVVSIHYDTAGESNSVHPLTSDGAILGWFEGDAIPTLIKVGDGLTAVLNAEGGLRLEMDR